MRLTSSPFLPFALCTALTLPVALSLTLNISQAHADEFKTNSKLTAATVFTNRATLTRTAKLEIPAGKHAIIFENLPANLFRDSLRIEGEGSTQATLGALSSKIVNSVELTSEREQQLNAEKEKLENQKKTIEADTTALKAKLEFLKSLNAHAANKTNEEQITKFDLNTDQWESAANTIYKSISETLKASLQKSIEIKEINDKINKINQDLNQLRTGQKRSYEVRLPIESKTAGTITLDLSYQLSNVSWHPVYDARLDTTNQDLELTQYGALSQRTGEDWSNIELTLSTAQPQRGATIPYMPPMWVDFQKSYVQTRERSKMSSNISSSIGMDAAQFRPEKEELAADPVSLDIQTATINANGFSAEYEIPGLSTIPADGTQTKVLIAPFELDTALEVHLKPQITNNAYLIAKSTLQGETPILPGMVNLFRDGGYIGQTQIPLLRSGEEYALSFGIDDQISVDHKIIKDESGEEGILIGKSKTIERQTITEIQNLHNQDITIVTLQNIPVAKNEDIDVKILPKHTTPNYESDYDNQKGLTRWSFVLKPQGKKDIQLGYSVSWPKDQTLTGLR